MAISNIAQNFLSKGKISQENYDLVQKLKSESGSSESEILLANNLVSEKDIAQLGAEIFDVQFVDLEALNIEKDILNLIDVGTLKRSQSVPYSIVGDVLKIAMVDPLDLNAKEFLKAANNDYKLEFYYGVPSKINELIDGNVDGEISSEVNQALADVEDDLVENIDVGDIDEGLSEDLQSAPVARIVNSILMYAVKAGVSDVHIEPLEKGIRVRYRIHGMMVEKLKLPNNMKANISARIKIMSKLKIDEKRLPQDGRFKIVSKGHKVDIRVSILPIIYGEKIVMRLLDTSAGVPSLETSGMRGQSYERYIDSIKSTNGIILVTGPTGSGKTRTLAGTLVKINDPNSNVISLEDPVEIRVDGVNQVQVNSDIGFTFASGLRSILRQDPDKVMVGEIRDSETAQLAVEASLTGHLVLSTLHTNSSTAAVARLIEMGVESYLLAATLRTVVAQRLPRRLCNDCVSYEIVNPKTIEMVNETMATVKGFDFKDYMTRLSSVNESKLLVKKPEGDDYYLAKSVGCSKCSGTGYKGRIGIFEVFVVDDEISKMISDGAQALELSDAATAKGMITMIQDGFLRAFEGTTTIEEVLRVSRE